MREPLLQVFAVGAATPVGGNGPQTFTSLRAGIAGFQELAWARDRNAELIITAAAGYLTGSKEGVARLTAMAKPAIMEAWSETARRDPAAGARRWAVFLSTGNWESTLRPPPLVATTLSEAHIEAWQEELGILSGAPFTLMRGGQAEVFFALEEAWKLISRGTVDYVMIGGVDSLLQYEILFDLDLRLRIKTGYQSEGFVPGEAAAFLVLGAYNGHRAGEGKSIAIAGIGTAEERHTYHSGKPCLGEGLTEAIRRAFQGQEWAIPKLDGMICDLDGERCRSREWALAYTRALGTCSGRTPPLWCPAASIGNAGAALGPVCLAWAATALREGYAPGSRLLVWGSSDDGKRGAAFMIDPTRAVTRG